MYNSLASSISFIPFIRKQVSSFKQDTTRSGHEVSVGVFSRLLHPTVFMLYISLVIIFYIISTCGAHSWSFLHRYSFSLQFFLRLEYFPKQMRLSLEYLQCTTRQCELTRNVYIGCIRTKFL